MNQIEHQLTLLSPVGDKLDIIPDGNFAGLTYTLKENEPGVLDLFLPGDYDRTKLKIDSQIEIRRAVAGSSLVLEGETAFFIRKVYKSKDKDGVGSIHVTAYSALDLMRRRIVAYYAGASYTDKVDMFWDDMVKEIVRENYGALATDTDRNLSPWLTIEPDYHWGASYTHSMPRSIVLKAMQEIIDHAREHGVYCSVDVVRTDQAEYEFRVFLGPRGADHTADAAVPVIVSEDRFNLSMPSLDDDWQEERNFIYAAGQGQEDERIVKTAQDDARIGISPFNRQEWNEDARQVEIDASVQSKADAALEDHRPKKKFSGAITQTEGCMYGLHWNWGDMVTAEYEGYSFDCHVDTVTVAIARDGTEVVTGQLRSVEDVT